MRSEAGMLAENKYPFIFAEPPSLVLVLDTWISLLCYHRKEGHERERDAWVPAPRLPGGGCIKCKSQAPGLDSDLEGLR